MALGSKFNLHALRGLLVAGVLAPLCSCANPSGAPDIALASNQHVGDICSGTMGFDVSGAYYASCRDYLRRHSQGQGVVAGLKSEPAEHKACEEIGLAEDTPDYKNCVQEMYQLDLGSQHL
jgi:hypothetical protein